MGVFLDLLAEPSDVHHNGAPARIRERLVPHRLVDDLRRVDARGVLHQQQEDLVFYEDGSVDIVREADVTAEELWDAGAEDIFSFGPGLVIDGEISVVEGEEVKRAQVTNPRTAFGVISPLHFLFVVSDGRTNENVGLSLLELADLMKDLGCVTAYNLDGGGSSTMWFNGRVLNKPTTFGDTIAERNISDIVYISK